MRAPISKFIDNNEDTCVRERLDMVRSIKLVAQTSVIGRIWLYSNVILLTLTIFFGVEMLEKGQKNQNIVSSKTRKCGE